MKLSIVIVSYNTRDALSACLRSLSADSMPTHEVFVVDNASSDGSAAMIRDEFPRIELIENDENRGFGSANNQAIERATGDYVLFLNSDASLEPPGLARLIASLDTDATIGAAGPQLIDAQGHLEPSWGNDATLWRSFVDMVRRRLLDRRVSLTESWLRWRSRAARDVDWLSGACLLSRRTLLKRIGGFDPRFFLYMEDVDLCRRLREAGFRVRFDPSVRVPHIRGLSTRSNDDAAERARVEGIRSRLEFFRKYRPGFEAGLYRAYLRWRRPRFRTETARKAFEDLIHRPEP